MCVCACLARVRVTNRVINGFLLILLCIRLRAPVTFDCLPSRYKGALKIDGLGRDLALELLIRMRDKPSYLYGRSGKRSDIQHDNAEGVGFDSR